MERKNLPTEPVFTMQRNLTEPEITHFLLYINWNFLTNSHSYSQETHCL